MGPSNREEKILNFYLLLERFLAIFPQFYSVFWAKKGPVYRRIRGHNKKGPHSKREEVTEKKHIVEA